MLTYSEYLNNYHFLILPQPDKSVPYSKVLNKAGETVFPLPIFKVCSIEYDL